ncbi:hypothetical protein IEO21_05086 [Rhodonia placenta]|uniref:Uncharacterized protein n=1 Tax=Rhodonia placenta TaxID=104341 RepID=A0A8H7P327_9APHY|nr:hypothetical protein IEO21_05086 [Postia placenta]
MSQLGQQQPQSQQHNLPQRQDIPQTQASIQQERYSQLRQRAQAWTAKIKSLEQDLAHHNQQRAAMPEITHQLKAKQYTDQINRLKDDLHKMFSLIKGMAEVSSQQRMPSNSGDMNGGPASHHPAQNNPQQGSSSQSFQPPQMMSGQVGNALQGGPALEQPKKPSADSVKPFVGLDAGRFPTEAEIQQASLYKELLLEQLIRPGIHNMRPQHIPPEHEPEYAAVFQELCGYAGRVFPALELLICAYHDHVVKKVIAATMTALRQKELSEQKGSPYYLIGLENIRNITNTMKAAAEAIPYRSMRQPHLPPAQQGNGGHSPAPQQRPITIPPSPRQPHQPPQPPSVPQVPEQPPFSHLLSTPPVKAATPQPGKRRHNPPGSSPAEHAPSTSTPPASASTPAANAQTPLHTASSPQTPQTPKTKAQPRPKPRRPTKAKPQTPAAVSASIPPPATTAPAPTSALTPSHVPAPSPAESKIETPAATPSLLPSAATPDVGVKRPREEEPTVVGGTPNGAPSPKKMRTEWEDSTDVLVKKDDSVDHIQNEADACQFVETVMSDLEQIFSTPEGADAVSLAGISISETLEHILKGITSSTESTDASSSSGGYSDTLDLSGFSSTPPKLDGCEEYFDFSSFGPGEDEMASKAPTPDLVPASSTNPSPGSGSGSDIESGHGSSSFDSAKIAGVDGDDSEILRLGMWQEVDGGVGAYFNPSDMWKWDGPMPSADGWAMFT